MQVPMLDLKTQYKGLKDEIMPIIDKVCDSQYFVLGKTVEDFEKACADYCGTKYAVGVSSGSDALLVALMIEGIGQGDEVITVPFTFFATIGAISRVGATPVLVDIDPDDFNIDPKKIEAKVTKKTKAIIPVHLFGQMAKMDEIMAIAKKHNLIVIEDAAQVMGAEYLDKRAGSYGHYGCFSFYPSKNIGAFGDGGLVTTNDPERYEKLIVYRNHGAHPKTRYFYKYIGGNFRLDALQAAVLQVKLKYLDKWSEERRKNAEDYRRIFKASKVGNRVKLPVNISNANRHIYNQFCVLFEDGKRDKVKTNLAEAGVGSDIYYPLSLHMQECFSNLGYKEGDFPISERTAKNILAIPIYPELTTEQRQYVVSTIERAL